MDLKDWFSVSRFDHNNQKSVANDNKPAESGSTQVTTLLVVFIDGEKKGSACCLKKVYAVVRFIESNAPMFSMLLLYYI